MPIIANTLKDTSTFIFDLSVVITIFLTTYTLLK